MIYNNVTWVGNWREMQDKITELNNKRFKIVQIFKDDNMNYIILYEKYVDVEKEFNNNEDENLIKSLKFIKNYCKNNGCTCIGCNKKLKNICNEMNKNILPLEWDLEN